MKQHHNNNNNKKKLGKIRSRKPDKNIEEMNLCQTVTVSEAICWQQLRLALMLRLVTTRAGAWLPAALLASCMPLGKWLLCFTLHVLCIRGYVEYNRCLTLNRMYAQLLIAIILWFSQSPRLRSNAPFLEMPSWMLVLYLNTHDHKNPHWLCLCWVGKRVTP